MNLIVKTNGKVDVVEITDETLEALKNKITPEAMFKLKYPNMHWEESNEYLRLLMNDIKHKIRVFKEVFEYLQRTNEL